MELNIDWAVQVIREDTDEMRFEAFAVALVEEITKSLMVKTSRNYDKGADGRSLNGRGHQILATATLQKGIANSPLKNVLHIRTV